MPPNKGKKRQVTPLIGPRKRSDPPPPCSPNCNCLGCLDHRRDDVTMAATPQLPLPPPPPPVLNPGIPKSLKELTEQLEKLKAETEACKEMRVLHERERLLQLRRPPTYIDSGTSPLPSLLLPLPTDTRNQRWDAVIILMEALEDTLLASFKAGDRFVDSPCLERFSDLDTELLLTSIRTGTTTDKNPNIRGFYYPANESKDEAPPPPPPPPLLPPRTYVDSSTSPPSTPPVRTYAEAAIQASPPPPPPQPQMRIYTEAATQASLPLLPPPPPLLPRIYAKAAVQASEPPLVPQSRLPQIVPPPPLEETTPQPALPLPLPVLLPPPPLPPVLPPLPLPPQPAMRAIVLHAAPTHRKPGEMRRWLEEDNKGVSIAGVRWLLQEGRRLGKAASSLVIYLTTPLSPGKLRMGRKSFRTTCYDWDLPVKDKGKGRMM